MRGLRISFEALVFAAAILASLAPVAADWPQWRGPNRDGMVTGALVPEVWPRALKEEWKMVVGVGHASPVESQGRIYVFARQGEDEVLLCLDAVTGVIKWSNDSEGPAYASPIIVTLAGVRQIVTTMQNEFVGVDAGTGKLLWKLPAKSEYETNSVTPVAYKDTIVLSREGQGLTAIRLVKQGAEIVPQEVWNNKEVDLYLN